MEIMVEMVEEYSAVEEVARDPEKSKNCRGIHRFEKTASGHL